MKKFLESLFWIVLAAIILYFFIVFLPPVFHGDNFPHSVMFNLYGLKIRWYGVLIAAGILTAYLISEGQLRKEGVKQIAIDGTILLVLIFGLIGARTGFVIQNLKYFGAHPAEIFMLWTGGLSIQGAIIGGVIGLIVAAKNYKVKFMTLANCISPTVLLAIAIGRFGNFFNQEIVGRPASLNYPFKMYVEPFFRPEKFTTSAYFHPVFLYESVMLLAAYGIYILIRNKFGNRYGFIYAIIGYSVIRLISEFFRYDYQPILGPFDLAQIVSFGFIILIVIYYFVFLTKRPE